MSLSDEIKAAIGGDGKSRHQTQCLYDLWSIKAKALEAERDRLREALQEAGEYLDDLGRKGDEAASELYQETVLQALKESDK